MDKNTQEKAVAELRALLKPLIDHFRKEHNLSQQDMISLITGPEEMVVPVSIFSIPLGPLQCLVKYLKEEHGMKYVKIAVMLNKDQRVIWKSYSDANKKFPSRIEIKDNDFFIPISAFKNDKLSILEIVVFYLRVSKGFSVKEIGMQLNKKATTIYTTYHRAELKNAQKE